MKIETGIVMDDGCRLAATLYLPPGDQRQPCLLEALPYRKDDLTLSYADEYARLSDEYELPERDMAVDRKLALVGDTTRTVLELVQDQRTVRLELYIIGLIAIEILLSIYELFVRAH